MSGLYQATRVNIPIAFVKIVKDNHYIYIYIYIYIYFENTDNVISLLKIHVISNIISNNSRFN